MVRSTTALHKSRFIIKRKDITVDDVVLETEGLTVGRLITNDIVINHRTVSRTHAGISAIGQEYWLFNLSNSNGTMLNGELVDKSPLANGDVIQIGRYLIQIQYEQGALAITVEMEVESHPVEGRTTMLHTGATGLLQSPDMDESQMGTLIMQKITIPGHQTVTPGGTRRLEGTGLLTSALQPSDEQALKVFWEKRKREAGKIAVRSPLHPRGGAKVGKIQFNWRPTLDLKKLWRKSYFSWGIIIVVVLALAALFLHDQAYSPGEISDIHSASTFLSGRNAEHVALRPNAGQCNDCHKATEKIDTNCTSCHTTEHFSPAVSKGHTEAGIGCIACHGEHLGSSFKPAQIGSAMCVSCHNDTYKFKGAALGSPHGGTVGYPVVNNQWQWTGLSEQSWKQKQLPDAPSKYTPVEQFHMVHVTGRLEGRLACTDCHSAGLHTEAGLRQSPKSTCAACHSASFDAAGDIIGPNCTTCHVQHGIDKDLVASIRAPLDKSLPTDITSESKNIPTLGVGNMQVIRQDDSGSRWAFAGTNHIGAIPWYGWLALVGILPVIGFVVMAVGSARRKGWIKSASAQVKPPAEVKGQATKFLDLEKLKAEGPSYPHPVVDPLLCIGCHACVEACPHDVLDIVNGVSTPVALDQCMEDTACTVECPTNPKACIVINTTKTIQPRKVPQRNQKLMTNVEGVYMIGDVSGVPLIKNAINEGAQVIDCIVEDLKSGASRIQAEYDVAIIGIGPAGLSATALAKQQGLSYIAIEQDQVVSTIQNYPAGKYVFFKPDTVEAKGGMPLAGAGNQKEFILESWTKSMMQNNLVINEEESCKDIKREGDASFVVMTEKGKLKEKVSYRARRVILAIGNRGTPMKLRVSGEDIKFLVQPEPAMANHCPKCGKARTGTMQFCVACGTPYPKRALPPFEDTKVKFKLSDPDDYVGKKCIVVGAGNSAIECAVDLTGFKRDGDKITFTRTNEVTLVVRSDFKGDLKLGNKMNVYDCMDAGKIKVMFRTEIKEITEKEVALMDTRSKQETARIANDYIFALIGGEKPTKFLEGIGIKIG